MTSSKMNDGGYADIHYIPSTLEQMRVIEIFDILPGTAAKLYQDAADLAMISSSRPINLLIRSNGGSVFEAVNMVNGLRDIKSMLGKDVPIIGAVQGNAMSAASYVLQACDRRYAAPNSIIMVHGITSSMGHFDESDQERDLALMRHMRSFMVDLYSARSTKDREWWDNQMKTNQELYLTAQEALEYGLVDEVR